ncbi:PREDICTED: exocyst complex component 4 [Ceratosolen solmsi marchali]|uniref:Exocyst complex component Sec8 n=1 Tax=Ceratosolen solmsi marchali TaxID=326594 RepID=A0AAJ6YH75_9HYME|nr:PREDICTED: exocyst complex component 4 [Ceratosolen solmsi marchali]
MESSTAPPVKPPRGIKPSKETSGLLITVIRALSASETNEQREVEKAKLEKDYKRCDQRLDELVSTHEEDLTEVMRIFGILSEQVTAARERIHSVKENLNACKQLLNCRREELMKLWLEGVEHKHVLQLLNDIDELKGIPAKLSSYLEKKHYLHATQLLVSALSMGDKVLEGVEALREVRSELESKKQKLSSKLLEELNNHLYKEQLVETGLKRQGSNRDFQRGNEARSSKGNKVKRNLLDVAVPGYLSGQISRKTSNVGLEDLNNLVEDEGNLNPEENSEHFLAIIIECLALLNQIPEAIEVVKAQMQNELLKIIEEASKNIKELPNKEMPLNVRVQTNSALEEEPTSQSPLLELLNIIFERFQQVIASHSLALCGFTHVIKKHNLETSLYGITDVWNNIQAVIQILLTEYLDVQNMVDGPFQSSVSLNEQTNDINVYFAKKRPQRPKNGLLFKFDSSTHTMSFNNYLKDHSYSSLTSAENKQSKSNKKLVCKPDPKNITLIFRPIMQFIDEIERAMGVTTGNSMCTLSNFLADYVKEVYLGRHHVLVATTIEAATKSPDSWLATTSPELMRDIGLNRPLLQSTVKVQQCVAELRLLMIALPLQGEHFCTLVLNVLHNYRETCQNAYRDIVQPDRHDRLICSAAWLKDEDISRFIKSLPNWESMKSQVQYYQAGPSNRRVNRRQETHDEESPDDVRERNLKEAEILASNLGEGGVGANEIISDIEQLRSLSLLQESVEWFSFSIRSLIRELQQSNHERNIDVNTLPPIPNSLVQYLEQVADEYDELANTCILVLHLEVRVQCFYYLHPRAKTSLLCTGAKDPDEADSRVEELSRVLQHMDEAFQSTLHQKKTKYIFEGLGHLIAKILITSGQYIERIDKSGIQRMCRNVFTLQQTLTNITMTRELALDHARQYFELFYETPEEILNNMLENGPQFSELEYINAFQLIARSQQEYVMVNKNLEKLSEILGDVGVTV